MSKISLTAKLVAADGKKAELEAAFERLIEAAAAEDGLEVYSVHRSDAEPGVYYFFELYRDADAFAVHGKGEQMRQAMREVGGLLAGQPEVTMMIPVAAKGLEL